MTERKEDFRRETDLINQRLGQLLTSQSIFFASLAFFYALKEDKCDNAQFGPVLAWFPILGVSIAVLCLISILASIIASHIIKHKYKTEQIGVNNWTTWMAWFSAIVMPCVFIAAWVVIWLNK